MKTKPSFQHAVSSRYEIEKCQLLWSFANGTAIRIAGVHGKVVGIEHEDGSGLSFNVKLRGCVTEIIYKLYVRCES